MKAHLGILETHMQAVTEQLNKLLSDEVVLSIKTRNYHWNIEGSNFNEMHKFYKKQYEQLDSIVDRIAERIRMLGHYTEARLSDYLKLTSLVETPYTNLQNEQLKYLLASHETIIHNLRRLIPVFLEKHKDVGSSDFTTRLLVEHEEMAWIIRSYFG